jgi:DNA-binding transcriptional ArsR family regulator
MEARVIGRHCPNVCICVDRYIRSVSKHLRVLRDAGFVEATIDAQRRLYRIRPGPLQEVDAWMAPFRRYWSAHVDALERHLDRMATPARFKRQSRKQR